MDDLDHYMEGLSVAIGKILEWVANKLHKIVISHKKKLPSRSQQFKYLAILWTLIPQHKIYGHYNEFKNKFNNLAVNTVKLFREMDTLKLSSWDSKNLDYFEEGKISHTGLLTFWQAVNNTFEEWDRNQMKASVTSTPSVAIANKTQKFDSHQRQPHIIKPKSQYVNRIPRAYHREGRQDKYHWHPQDSRFKLPKLQTVC